MILVRFFNQYIYQCRNGSTLFIVAQFFQLFLYAKSFNLSPGVDGCAIKISPAIKFCQFSKFSKEH